MFSSIYCPDLSAAVSLADFGYSFSPIVEETTPDCVVLDVAGCELRFGSAYKLASEISSHALRPKAEGGLGQRISVSLAGNPDSAILAARFLKGITFIEPGEELTALGDLPIEKLLSPRPSVQGPNSGMPKSILKPPNSRLNRETLDLGLWTLDPKQGEEILETLRLWGVRTFRDFVRLPTTGVAERLGQDGVKLQQLAAGKTERHLQLKQPAPIFDNQIELDYPLAELEPLSFIFARLLNQLCARLLAYALATNELRISLKLEDGATHERRLSLPAPLRDHKIFLKLLLLDTEAHPPPRAVVGVAIACEPVKPRVLQSGLFIPQAPEAAKLELTLARLVKLVGRRNVGSPAVVDTHRPDTFQLKRFVVSADRKTRRGTATGRWGAGGTGKNADKVSPPHSVSPSPRLTVSPAPHLASPPHPVPASPHPPASPFLRLGFRMFRPPLRAMVDASRGYPQQISAWGPNRSVYGRVVQLSGPWRKTGDWWRDDSWGRDEWDVAIEQSGAAVRERAAVAQVLYRIYRELRSGAWFVEGRYD
jgi:protein ImuB